MIEEIRAWITGRLIDADGYFSPAGFEFAVSLYSTPLSWSFVLSLIDGGTQPAPFRVADGRSKYEELIRAVKQASRNEAAFWFYITDPDNCHSVLEWVEPCHYDHTLHAHLQWFETSPADEGGCSYLGLAGSSKQWLLLHEYNRANSFGISLHGPSEFCRQVAASVGIIEYVGEA
jgi:hypothetical protein